MPKYITIIFISIQGYMKVLKNYFKKNYNY